MRGGAHEEQDEGGGEVAAQWTSERNCGDISAPKTSSAASFNSSVTSSPKR